MSGPSLLALAWLVARDVNRSFGGGMASMELMRRSLARRRWLDEGGHGVLVAVSRFTPGTNVLAYCAALGWMYFRWVGAAVAVAAGSLPSALLVAVMTAAVAGIDRSSGVRVALAAATFIAGALVLSSAWALVRPHLFGSRRRWTMVAIALAAALYLAGATPVRVLLALAIWGAATPPREAA